MAPSDGHHSWDRWQDPEVIRLSLVVDGALLPYAPKLGPLLCAYALGMGQAILEWSREADRVEEGLKVWTDALHDAVAFLRSEVHGH